MESLEQESSTSSLNQPTQSSQPLFSDKLEICPTSEEILNLAVKLTEHLVGQGKLSAYTVKYGMVSRSNLVRRQGTWYINP